ncbi:MAG: hypothetical protein WAL88_09670 [Nitrosotalea sp.]
MISKKLLLIIIASIALGSIIGMSINASAQTPTIPSWVKNTAKWWGEGQISDSDYIQSLQWLIDNGILNISKSNSMQSVPPQSSQDQQNAPQVQSNTADGFSGTQCARDPIAPSVVHMTGKYTNGAQPYSFVSLKLGLLDSSGNVVATGAGIISNIGTYSTKIFDASAIYAGQFSSCDIQVETQLP